MFQYRVSWKKTAKVMGVTLESGDALVFGGRSRGIIHAVPGVGRGLPGPGRTPEPSVQGAASQPGEAGRRDPCPMPEDGRYNLNFREL